MLRMLYIPSHQVFSTFQRLTGRWRVKGHALIRRWIVITCLSAAVTSPVLTLVHGPAHTHKHCKYAGSMCVHVSCAGCVSQATVLTGEAARL